MARTQSKSKLAPPPILENIVSDNKATRAFVRYLLEIQTNTEGNWEDIEDVIIILEDHEARITQNESDITQIESDIGDLTTLTTDEKSNLVGAINEVDEHTDTNTTNIGDLPSLTTDDKSDLVGAINEVDYNSDKNATNIGDLNSLTTVNKTTIVGAINEIQSERTRWRGVWSAGEYPKNDMASNNSVLWIANKVTTEEPEFSSVGTPAYLLPEVPTWNVLQHLGSVTSGMRLTSLDRLYVVSKIRFWVNDISANYTYRHIQKDNITGKIVLKNEYNGSDFASTGWQEFVIDDTFPPNRDISLLIIVANSSSDTLYNHPWVFTGETQSDADPLASNANKINNNSRIRINKTDRDTTDRSAELAQAEEIGTIIRYSQESDVNKWEEWEVLGSTNNATFVIYNTVLVNEGTSGTPDDGSNIQIYFTVPVPANTDYVELPNGVSTYTKVQGDLELSGTPRVYNDNGYAVDVEIQEFLVPTDWDVMGSFNF